MQNSRFYVEGRSDAFSAEEIRTLHRSGLVTASTRLSRDGKQWFAAVQLLNRLPEEVQDKKPPTPVLR
jgi:hypothetical protein